MCKIDMSRADLRVKGPQAAIKRYIVAAGTAIIAGEPVHNLGTYGADGISTVNTYVLVAADSPVVGTHRFGGVALRDATLASGLTTVAEQFLTCACPVPQLGFIIGQAETAASVDTDTELFLLLGDAVLLDYAATGAADGGELYTIKEAGSGADTAGFELVGGNSALQELNVVVDQRAYRHDVA